MLKQVSSAIQYKFKNLLKSTLRGFLLGLSPEVWGQHNKNGEEFQTSQKHQEATPPFSGGRKAVVVAHWI